MQNDLPSNSEILFEVATPIGFSVRTTIEYWQFIVTIKHPIMLNRLADIQATLSNPDENSSEQNRFSGLLVLS
jgi:hypothetical protein